MNHAYAHKPSDFITNLSNEFMHPSDAERAMRKCLNSRLKLQNRTITRDELQRLDKTGTNDVTNLTKNILKKINNDKQKVEAKLIEFLMKIKLDDANKDLDKIKSIAEKDKECLDKIVRPGTVARIEYEVFTKKDTDINWRVKRKKMMKKIEYLKHKKFTRKNDAIIEGTFKGINVGDKEIGEVESKSDLRILGDISLDDQEEEAMTIFPKDRCYSKITKEQADENVEVCFAKMRWDEKGVEEDIKRQE